MKTARGQGQKHKVQESRADGVTVARQALKPGDEGSTPCTAHCYGLRYERGIIGWHLMRSLEEIAEHRDLKFRYPHHPQEIYEFNYCPKCGAKL